MSGHLGETGGPPRAYQAPRNERIFERYQAQESLTVIAAFYGISRARVSQIVKRQCQLHGVPPPKPSERPRPPPKPTDAERDADIVARYARGETYREIGALYGFSLYKVFRIVKRHREAQSGKGVR